MNRQRGKNRTPVRATSASGTHARDARREKVGPLIFDVYAIGAVPVGPAVVVLPRTFSVSTHNSERGTRVVPSGVRSDSVAAAPSPRSARSASGRSHEAAGRDIPSFSLVPGRIARVCEQIPSSDFDTQALPRGVSLKPYLPDRNVLEQELAALLDEDVVRSQSLAFSARERRAAERAADRAGARQSLPPAVRLHVRARRARVRMRALAPSQYHAGYTASPPRTAHPHSAPAEAPAPRLVPRSPAVRRDEVRPAPLKLPSHIVRGRRRWNVREALRMTVGSLLLAGMVAVAVDVAELPKVGARVSATGRRGGERVLAGLHALAGADTRASSLAFAEAGADFREAANDLRNATDLVQRVIGRLDPASRLASAETVIRVGAGTAEIGAEATSIVELFQQSPQSLTETLAHAAPRLATLAARVQSVRMDLRTVDHAGLPDEVRASLDALETIFGSVDRLLSGFVASERVIGELLGTAQDRQYLVLFQNPRELRPTGGFIGSFALVDVSRGAIKNVRVDTIYNPDGQLREFIAPPEPLRKITDRWYTRDANWFAEFPPSARKVASLFERSGGPTVDGVLAVTPLVLQDLMRLTGPITMPDYGVTVTAENVVDETQRLVTYQYDRARNEPKAFLADLLPEVLAKTAALPRDHWGALADTLLAAAGRKHVLVYFKDDEAQRLADALGWAGTLPRLPAPSKQRLVDHLGRVEANIGGHKTDDRMEQHVAYDVTLGTDTGAVATLVVTRHHRGGPSGAGGFPPDEDPARKANVVYERTFVPSGSFLLEARGFTLPADVPTPFVSSTALELQPDPDLEELGRGAAETPDGVTVGTESGMTTFGGWVMTQPNDTSVTVLRYRLPWVLPRLSLVARVFRYELRLTQQPGHLPVRTEVTLRAPDGVRVVWAGPDSALAESGQHRVRYAATVERDATWGAVMAEE